MEQSILNNINKPTDLKSLNEADLKQLARECRREIIRTVSENGGHLASNLGVVELTLCLAHCFDFSEGGDRIIFDVGHQSYTWKLISGRRERFAGLRKKGGLSGFPKTDESPFDYFNTGHSSTSISAAIGFSRADRLSGKRRASIALIGDGALCGGMSFEALNDAGQRGDPIIVIINDNQMSIDENVGGLSMHLENLRISKGYRHMKAKVKQHLKLLPWAGEKLNDIISRFKSKLRRWHRGSGSIYEALGYRYYGPVDGHDIHSLLRHLEAVRDSKKPVVLHVLTNKGEGYRFAENEPSLYHGVAPFVVEHGIEPPSSSGRSYTSRAGEILCELAARHPEVCAITAAMTSGTGLSEFAKQYPERFFDVGIAEQHAVTMGAGMAASGKKVFIALYSTFAQRAVDQIIHDVCLQDLPVCFLLDHGGAVSGDGETHQGIYDISLFQNLPHLEMYFPADAADLSSAMEYALRSRHPLAIRYPKESLPPDLDLPFPRELSRARKLRSGEDLAVFALGTMIHPALEAADLLSAKGYTLDVFSCSSGNLIQISDMMKLIKARQNILTIEDGILGGGFASRMLPEILKACPGTHFRALGITNPLAGQASRQEILKEEGLDAAGIMQAVYEMIPGKGEA